MSYNSSKGPQNIGDLINEDDPDTLIDWESDKIVFKTNSTKRFTIDNNEISGSGAAVIMGATVLGSSLKVSGSTTFAGGIVSPVSSSGLATFVGGVVTEGNLKVSGSTTLGDASGDSVTLTAATVNIPNVAAGTDNTVVIYNGSTLLTDEIDSKVWGGALVDTNGNGSTNYITTFVDADTVGGSANLTFDGTTLILTGAIITSAAAQLLGNTTLGNAASDVITATGQLTASAGVLLADTVTLGNAAADVVTVVGQVTASAGVLLSSTLEVDGAAQFDGSVTLGNAASDVVTLTGQLTGSAPVKFTNTLEVDGNVTLGNAGADTVTINATTVNIPNVAAGTDNTVVVYNGSTLLTDEIDSKVWGGSLVDVTGTPSANQVTTWSDADTVAASANLTFDGTTLTTTGLSSTGTTTLGNASSDVVTLTGQVTASSGLVVAGDALIVANGIPVQFLGNTTLGNTASDVTTLTGQMTASAGVLLSSTLTVAGNTTLGNASSDTVTSTAQLTASAGAVVSGDGLVVTNGIPAQFLGNTTLGNAASDVVTVTGQLTASAPVKLTNTLEVDGNTTLGNASGDSVTINAATVNIPNVAAGTDNTVVVYNGSTLLTDEIDSRVWGSTLVDASGTPAANQIATWTDANTAQGASTLTYDGTTLYVATANISGAQGLLNMSTGDMILSGAISGSMGRFNVETGDIIFSGSISGDGSGLTNTGTITSYATSGDNRILTSVDSTSIQGEADLTFDGNTLTTANASNTAIPALTIDRNYTGTTSIGNYTTDPQGLLIDYDVTGIVASGQTAIHDAIAIHFNQDSPTHVGTLNSTGLDCRMTGGTSGTQSMKGVAINLAGADTHTGVDITVPNDGTHIIARSPDNILDQFKISVGAAGATTLSTNDADAALANLTLVADGKIIIEAAAGDEVVFNEGDADVDFRVETADESHMLFIEGSSNRMSIGDNTGSPGATLEVKNNATAGATGVPLVQLNSNDTDQQCLDINADNITANVVNVTANAVTTARVLAIGADGLTTGNAIHVDDNSPSTGTRNTALIIQNHTGAIAATALGVQSDGGITGVKIDKNFSDTSAATVTGLEIDFDKTATTTSNNTMYGLNIDMDNTTATNGTNYMYGLHVTPTLTHAADAGTTYVYGAHINAQGGTNGGSLVQAARFEAGGGDFNFGIQLDVEDGGVDLRIESSADSGDYFQIQTTTHGATTITTVDDDAAAADLTFSVDGNIILSPVGTTAVNSDLGIGGVPTLPLDVQSTSPAAGRLANTANDAYGSLLRLQNTRADSNAGVADDFCGGVVFTAQDSTAAATQYGKITTKVASPTNTAEAGFMTFEVTTGGTTATEYLRLDGGTTSIEASADTVIKADTYLSGGMRMNYAVKTANHTLTSTDRVVVFNAGSAATASLPALTDAINGVVYTIKTIGAGAIHITGAAASENFLDGQQSLTLAQGDAATVLGHMNVSGYEWAVINFYNMTP